LPTRSIASCFEQGDDDHSSHVGLAQPAATGHRKSAEPGEAVADCGYIFKIAVPLACH
jgi:hypothetical protein